MTQSTLPHPSVTHLHLTDDSGTRLKTPSGGGLEIYDHQDDETDLLMGCSTTNGTVFAAELCNRMPITLALAILDRWMHQRMNHTTL